MGPSFSRGPRRSQESQMSPIISFRIKTEAAAIEIFSVDWLPASCSGIHGEGEGPVGSQTSTLAPAGWPGLVQIQGEGSSLPQFWPGLL